MHYPLESKHPQWCEISKVSTQTLWETVVPESQYASPNVQLHTVAKILGVALVTTLDLASF
jgi:hypothetical protein